MPRWPNRADRATRRKLLRKAHRLRDRYDEEEHLQLVAQRWREAREAIGLSQAEVADAVGPHRQSWCADVEAGRQFPRPKAMVVMSRLSGRSVGWLLGEEE